MSRLIVPFALLATLASATAQETAAPMSRAERDASNPLRMIIEASKIKSTRNRAGDAVPRVVVKAPAVAASAAAPVATAPTAGASTVAATTGVAPEALAAAEPEPAVPQEAAAPPPAPAVPVPVPEDKIPPPELKPEPVPALPPAAVPAPTLARMVEPVTPRQLLGKLRGDVEVVVAFTINPDGSISDATVKSSSHRQMDASVLDAVQQWRYEPIPAARSHMVQLVLRQGE